MTTDSMRAEFEAWLTETDDYVVDAQWEAWQAARRAPASVQADSQALTALDADMVWPAYDDETFHHSIDDAVEYEVDQAWPVTGELELKLQLAKRIPNATIRIFNITENGHEWEIVSPASTSADRESNRE